MNLQASTQQQTQSKRLQSALLQNIAVVVFGVIVLFAVGFLPMGEVHNAAHDTRHALAFPCH